MLYVAGEILLWMLLALALGVLAGWAIWGLRSRADEQRTAAERQHLAALRDEGDQLRAQNEDLLAQHARDAATIAHLQQSAGGDTAPLVARIRELEADLDGRAREADLLRRRLFELEQLQARAEEGQAATAGPGEQLAPTAPVTVTEGHAAADAERERLQAELDALRTRFGELGKAFGGQLDLGDPAAVRVRWSALQARAAESDHLARQLDGLRAVLGGQLDPAELQERFTDLEERAGEADSLRARLAQLDSGGTTAHPDEQGGT